MLTGVQGQVNFAFSLKSSRVYHGVSLPRDAITLSCCFLSYSSYNGFITGKIEASELWFGSSIFVCKSSTISIRLYCAKGALSGRRQIVATESALKLIKNAFYIFSKALFILKIFKFLF